MNQQNKLILKKISVLKNKTGLVYNEQKSKSKAKNCKNFKALIESFKKHVSSLNKKDLVSNQQLKKVLKLLVRVRKNIGKKGRYLNNLTVLENILYVLVYEKK